MAALDDFQAWIEQWTDQLLGSYTESIPKRRPVNAPKEFNDPVWGTIVLTPFEVRILDSPLLQRLRHIRQLGVAHLVFPGANHSRFEHSLGVLHQVEQLVAALNTPLAEEVISDTMRKHLRLAGLCHDVGHGFMSHVSEHALESFEAAQDIRLEFADRMRTRQKQLSEIAAYYMLGSDAFGALLDASAQSAQEQDVYATDTRSVLQKAVISTPISDAIPLAQDLISGPFDADKLDYMPRDALASGVPVVTDISRLVRKVRSISVPQEDLPEEIAKRVTGNLGTYTLMGIALSGGRTLDELMIGRTLLFDKIYRHQKVRAAEGMVSSLLECVAAMLSDVIPAAMFMFTDDQIINFRNSDIEEHIGRELTTREAADAAVAVALASQLRNRQLLARSFAFSLRMPHDPYIDEEDQLAGLTLLIEQFRDQVENRSLRAEIAAKAREIIELLGADLPDHVDVDNLEAFIALDPPRETSGIGDISRALLVDEDGKLVQFDVDSAESKGWADAYLLARDIGFVFAPPSLAEYIFLATERIFRSAGVRIPPSMISYAKLDRTRLAQLRRDLADKSFYDGAPADLLPLPERLGKADIKPKLLPVEKRLSGYAGPGSSEEVHKVTLDQQRIIDWLSQIRHDDLIDQAIDMVQRVRLIGRSDTRAALSSFASSYPDFKGASVVPLGMPKDSSAISTYFAGDLAASFDWDQTSMSGILDKEGPVLFVDDFVGTGNQGVSIFEGWLGEEPTTDLGEQREGPLPGPVIEALRNRRIGIVFAAGRSEGRDRLIERLQELGLDVECHIQLVDDALPRAFEDESSGVPKEFFREVGSALLDDGRHDDDWIEHRALGYGNHAYLVVFPYNTPSQTLTALWRSGTYNDSPWTALFPRRKKL